MIKTALKRLLPSHPYSAIHPYNLLWKSSFIKTYPYDKTGALQVIDIGGRGGSLEELEGFREHMHYISFDADAEEAERLSVSLVKEGFNKVNVYPYLIHEKKGLINFNLYKNRAESSMYGPNPVYRDNFRSDFAIDKSLSLEAVSLDELYAADKITDVDLIKLDTQGSEFNILQGAVHFLDSADILMIESETEFYPMYKDQPLYHDIAALLHQKGYMLLFLNRVYANRSAYKGISRGQLIFGDALFGLNEERTQQLSSSKKLKYIYLLINYGCIDYAYQIFQSMPSFNDLPFLANYFRKYNRKDGKLRKAVGYFIDNILFKLLIWRKTNRMSVDSDRSYPVR